MKVLVVVCAVVLLLQIGALGLSFGTGDVDHPERDQIEDGEWHAENEFPLAAKAEAFLDRFRPRLKLPWDEQFFASDAASPVAFTHGGEGTEGRRVAKFELVAGTGASIAYACSIDKPGFECPQRICLCQPDKPVDALARAACPSLPAVCPADGHLGEIVVYGETGTLELQGLGAAGGTVRQR
ncbi:MAG TPA: hypothetical protein VF329_00135 [Gammaproteobacteria bacterium]